MALILLMAGELAEDVMTGEVAEDAMASVKAKMALLATCVGIDVLKTRTTGPSSRLALLSADVPYAMLTLDLPTVQGWHCCLCVVDVSVRLADTGPSSRLALLSLRC